MSLSSRSRSGHSRRKYRLLACLLAGLFSVPAGYVHADIDSASAAGVATLTPTTAETASGTMPAITLTADQALISSTARGMTLYRSSEDLKTNIPAASKLMTVVIALDALSLDTQVTISKDVEKIDESASFPLYLSKGEKCSVKYLVTAVLYRDSDAAARSLAEYISNSEDSFVARMNETAKTLNMTNTRFANTSGNRSVAANSYETSVQYSTLDDLSILFRYALNNTSFREILTKYRAIMFQNDGTPVSLSNTLVSAWGIQQIKGAAEFTGDSDDDRSSVIALASVDDFDVAIFLVGCKNDEIYQNLSHATEGIFGFYEVSNLVEAGDAYRSITIDGIPSPVDAVFRNTVRYIHPIGREYILPDTTFTPSKALTLPIRKGDLLGQVSFSLEDGTKIVTEVAAADGIYSQSTFFSDTYTLLQSNRNITVILILASAIFCLAGVIRIFFSIRKHQRARRRRNG